MGDMEAAALATPYEMTVIVAVAITLTLAGSWLGRSVSVALGRAVSRVSDTAGRPSSVSAVAPASIRSAVAGLFGVLRRWHEAASSTTANFLRSTAARTTPEHDARVAARAAAQPARTASPAQAVSAAAYVVTERLGLDAQWDRAATVVSKAIADTHAVRLTQQAAAEKLDVADYALERLMDELEGVMRVKPNSASVTQLSLVPTAKPTPSDIARAAA